MPNTPLSNSNSSAYMHFSRPYTRAMPSPTWMTVPVETISSFDLYDPICSWMIRVISSGLIFITGLS